MDSVVQGVTGCLGFIRVFRIRVARMGFCRLFLVLYRLVAVGLTGLQFFLSIGFAGLVGIVWFIWPTLPVHNEHQRHCNDNLANLPSTPRPPCMAEA